MKTEVIHAQAQEMNFLRNKLIDAELEIDRLRQQLRSLELKNKSLVRQIGEQIDVEQSRT